VLCIFQSVLHCISTLSLHFFFERGTGGHCRLQIASSPWK
jgi:hypothetical protein